MSAGARLRRWAAGILLGVSILMLRGLPAAAFVTEAVLEIVPDFASGSFERTGLISNPEGTVSGVQLMPIGLSGEWVQDTRPLPVRLQESATTSWQNRIYLVGGRLADGRGSKRAFCLSTAADGGIVSVQESYQLPVPLIGASAFVREIQGQPFIYVLGGLTEGTPPISTAVYRATISSSTGCPGSWQRLLSDQELPFGLYYSALAVRDSDIYLIGGIAHPGVFTTVPNILHTRIDVWGDLDGWDLATGPGDMPSVLPASFSGGVAAAQAVVHEGETRDTIYLTGGRSQAMDQAENSALVAVAAADINEDGSLSAWSESGANLPVPIHGHGAVLIGNSEILLAGGRTNLNDPEADVQSNVKAALIDPDNRAFPLYDWDPDPDEWNVWQTGVPFPDEQVRAYHGMVYVGDWVYALGGTNASNSPTNTIFRGRISGVGALYAPDGVYESPTMTLYGGSDLNLAPDVVRVEWDAVLPVGSLELEYSWRPVDGGWSDWQPLGVSVAGHNTYEFTPRLENAAQFRFRALFTGAPPYQGTPRLETLRVVYDAPPPDLAAGISASRSHVRPGNLVSFTAQYQNSGGVTAEGVQVDCVLPPYLTNQSPGWVEVAPQTFRYEAGQVPPGGSGSAKITALVDQIPEDVETLETMAIVSFPPMTDLDANQVGDPNPANNAASMTISATPLSIVGTASSSPGAETPLSPGDLVEYRLDYAVKGGAGTSGLVLSVAIDGSRLVDLQPLDGGRVEGSTVRWYVTGALPAGYEGTARLQARVKRPLANGTQIGLAFVASSYDLPAATVATIAHTVASQPRVTLSGTSDPSPGGAVLRGQTVTYSFTCLNDGGENASGVTVTASAGPQVQIVSTEPSGSISGQSVTWQLGTLPVDAPRELKIVGRIADTAVHSQIVIVGAELTGTGVPATSAQVQHTVRVPASLNLTKTVDPSQGAVRPGDVLTYGLVVTNVGGETSGPVMVTDQIPAYTQGLGDVASSSKLSWAIDGLAGGESWSLQYRVRVNDPVSETVREILSPAAVATHAGVTVRSTALRTPLAHWPNLWVMLSDGRDVVEPGERLTYTVRYGNVGGATEAVELVVELGPGLEWEGGSGWQPVGDGRYRLTVGALGTETRSSSFSARVSPAVRGDDSTLALTAEAAISGAAVDADPHDDRDVDLDIFAGPDLAVLSLRTTPESAFQGQYLSLQVEVGNVGVDALPPYATAAGVEHVVIEVYARQAVSTPPSGPLDYVGGYCFDAGCGVTRPAFRTTVPVSSLTPGARLTVTFPNVLHLTEAGVVDLYAQVDVGGDAVHGGFREANEINNLASLRRFPIADAGPGSGSYCLPLVLRSSDWE